jgi:hypothetical protein
LSQALSALSQANSAAHVSLANAVSVVSNALSALEVRVSALSTAPAGVSVTSTELSAVSAQAASAISQLRSLHDVLSNLVSNALSAGDVKSNTISAISDRITSISAQITSVDGRVNTVSNLVSVLSSRVGGSVPPIAMVSTVQSVSATALTNISGMSVSVSAGVVYEIRGAIMFSAVANVVKFGATFPALTQGVGGFRGWTTQLGGAAASAFSAMAGGQFDAADSGVVAVSVLMAAGPALMNISALIEVSTTGVFQVQMATSVATAIHNVQRGSFLRAYRIR